MASRQTNRENIMITTGFILAIIMIIASVVLIIILGRSLNQSLSVEGDLSEEAPIRFNLEAYHALEL